MALWPAPGSRKTAANCCGVFLPPQEAQGNPGGATSRLGAHALPIARNASPLDMALIRQDWGRAGRRKKKKKCRSNRPLRGQGPYRMFYSPAPRQERALRGEHRHPQVHRCSTQPSEKNLRRGLFLFSTSRQTPKARSRAIRNGGTHERLARETLSGTEDQRADVPRVAHHRAPQEDAHTAGAHRAGGVAAALSAAAAHQSQTPQHGAGLQTSGPPEPRTSGSGCPQASPGKPSKRRCKASSSTGWRRASPHRQAALRAGFGRRASRAGRTGRAVAQPSADTVAARRSP